MPLPTLSDSQSGFARPDMLNEHELHHFTLEVIRERGLATHTALPGIELGEFVTLAHELAALGMIDGDEKGRAFLPQFGLDCLYRFA